LHLEPVTNGGAFKRGAIGRAAKHRRAVARAFAPTLKDVARFADAVAAGRLVRCRIVRLARGEMDTDNLAACCKWVRDAVALFLGTDDGRRSPVAWDCGQERSELAGVRIEISTEGE
jgi:hypothetical protein